MKRVYKLLFFDHTKDKIDEYSRIITDNELLDMYFLEKDVLYGWRNRYVLYANVSWNSR